MGSIHPETVVLCDEITLRALQDWQACLLPLQARSCAVWAVGDMRNQMHAIGLQWHAVDMTADWSEQISAVGKRLTLTEGHRCDARLLES